MRSLRNRDQFIAFAVLLPSLILLGIFVYGFIAQTGYTSLTDWGRDPAQALSSNPIIRYIGFTNYQDLFSGFLDVRFRQDLVSALFFTVFFLLGCLVLGLLLAMMLDRNPRGEGFFRTVFLFPMALSFIVTGTVWRWMLQPAGGVNQIPTWFGAPAGQFDWVASRASIWSFDWNLLPLITALVVAVIFAWITRGALREGARTRAVVAGASSALLVLWALLGGPSVRLLPYAEPHGFNLALAGIILAAVWQMSGYTMALYLAGLRGIPDELREAARVDGASERQVYTRVIFPLLGPITLSAMIILGHISLKIFDLVFAMSGPDNTQTSVPALTMYITAFRGNQFAKGAAIGVILLLLVAAVIVPYLASTFRKEAKS
ncbi:carbohydrate ABC transporter permease [Deinococcus peraridilitoris]|uniref:Permease component of ABC-type sugar transporter n=1 Tax=Deinococcus peraridilitoris (strain DSM 19664 / LMG 22246 / CIP 109416 / KR-200) TaxID=937777 RepID=L0A5A5_DEIPD|nr:sugar ABC transporter permease [Deinococcus peraridilitoris]AFZ68599.1 permease component of ABC-type sugar transporter [Deinococcus peraridilitoris DSM 19664]